MITRKVASLIFLMALSITVAVAEETRYHEFDAAPISSLRLNMRVGTILVEHTNDDTISVELRITKEGRRWFSRSVDTATMDLEASVRNSALELSFDHKGIKTDWVVKIPALSKIEINAGVATIDVYMANADIDVDIGVGAVTFELAKTLVGDITLAAGVGDTSVTGASSMTTQRALVSSDLKASGDGTRTVRANIGVGSAEVDLI
ncbi:MAG: DUF4097 family beta strand repeat-containing protein [Pseudohongiella sp.]|nr:DUF4097 family beta strand repeat-containing protein [Pseudohongiella sp.]MDO9522087.1 DUF4097 family beta strand repeat-containing protein [Pseudohongiella sp.]MDP2129145.1 DUF4097 family beta strand repeat-containing protein [Pseudohongiella sp.]